MPEVITKRKRYTIETKRKVISMMQNGASLDDAISASNAPRQTIQLWMKNSIKIMSFKGSAKKKQIGNSGRPESIPFAIELKEFMTRLRDEEKALSACHIIDYIKMNHRDWFDSYLAKKNSRESSYKATLRLIERFCHRHGFSRQRTTTLKMTRSELEQIRTDFGAAFHHEYVGFGLDSIYNADETAIYYDMAPKTIWAVRGGSAKISNGEKHSYRMTAVLTVRADGVKLPILFIIRGAEDGVIQSSEFATYPSEHFYAMQGRAWMNGSVWKQYLYQVLAPSIENPSVLIVDNFDSHVSEESYQIIQEEFGSHLAPLPPNATSHCQPLDVSLMGPFKQHLRDLYLREDFIALTAAEKRRTMIERAIEAWEMITEEEVRQSFVKAIPRPVDD